MAARKKLVIVESPTKAKTIRRFLDSSYMVESCMGHIRDLPESAKDIPEKYKKGPWGRLGVNVDDGFKPLYLIPKDKAKVVSRLKSRLKEAGELILATDEDREGESISWHLTEILKPKVPVKRIVFHEITKSAITEALKNFRKVDSRLVRAQEARRVLDRLVGYTISPLLWKKITSGLSAGRVQSSAVKLISEREIERMLFVKTPYFSIEGEFSPETLNKAAAFPAALKSYKSRKIASGRDFDEKGRLKDKKLLHLKERPAQNLAKELSGAAWLVQSLEKKKVSRNPSPPFITSTLQQAASRQLGLSSRQAMSIAQKLYEGGLITYMRTDSTSLSKEAVKGIREAIAREYGKSELPPAPRFYKTKSKGAQEAHEAIRPAGRTIRKPEGAGLSGAGLKLYQLIWQRTLACQMKNCEQEQMSLLISAGAAVFSASGTAVISPGFYRAYKGMEDKASPPPLPPLKKGDRLNCRELAAKAKETQPPPRYTEASLIQTLEREGIGRPSTYAPIISAIQNRGYARKKDKKAIAPTMTALIVSKFLSDHLPDYVDLKFTSKMEESLDKIALGEKSAVQYLSLIYKGKKGLKAEAAAREKTIDGKQSRTIRFEPFKNISFHVGRFGAYVSMIKNKKEFTATLPQDFFLSDLDQGKVEALIKAKKKSDESIGVDPAEKKKIFLKTGRFGPYLEREGGGKRSSVPKFIPPEELSLKRAIQLLELPKTLGRHPKTGKEVKKSIGRFGPYVVHEGDFRSAPRNEGFFSIGLKEALEMLAKEKKRRGGAKKAAPKKAPQKRRAPSKRAAAKAPKRAALKKRRPGRAGNRAAGGK